MYTFIVLNLNMILKSDEPEQENSQQQQRKEIVNGGLELKRKISLLSGVGLIVGSIIGYIILYYVTFNVRFKLFNVN